MTLEFLFSLQQGLDVREAQDEYILSKVIEQSLKEVRLAPKVNSLVNKIEQSLKEVKLVPKVSLPITLIIHF